MKFNKNKLKDRIKKLLAVEDIDIIDNAIHNEETVKRELKKIVKHNEEKVREKPIDTSILIRKIEKKEPAPEPEPEPVAPVQHPRDESLRTQGAGIREKKFKCECGSDFYRKHDLTRHLWKSNKHIRWIHDNKKK